MALQLIIRPVMFLHSEHLPDMLTGFITIRYYSDTLEHNTIFGFPQYDFDSVQLRGFQMCHMNGIDVFIDNNGLLITESRLLHP